MKTHRISFWILSFVFISVLNACKKDSEVEEEIAPPDSFRGLVVPSHFPAPHYLSSNNPITEKGFELGRKLFYDPYLSIDNTVSCGTCHAQVHAFADHSVRFSTGVSGQLSKRNSPSMFNLAWNTSFMWDGGVNHIEVMPIAPLVHADEMGETIEHVVEKLNAHPTYPELFKDAFGADVITDQQMLWAFAQFMSMMISDDSKYDRVVLGKETFTAIEQQGYELFLQNCNSCHTAPLFTDYSFRNNGLTNDFTSDNGREHITLDPADRGKFKVPSLRNVQISYPYMHDGRLDNLSEVIDHYSEGIIASPTLDPSLSNMNFTTEEKAALIAFLYTLNDYSFLGNHAISEP